jgi:hypothetical protein
MFARLGISCSAVEGQPPHPGSTKDIVGTSVPSIGPSVVRNNWNDGHRDLPAISFAHTRHCVACQILLEALMEAPKVLSKPGELHILELWDMLDP